MIFHKYVITKGQEQHHPGSCVSTRNLPVDDGFRWILFLSEMALCDGYSDWPFCPTVCLCLSCGASADRECLSNPRFGHIWDEVDNDYSSEYETTTPTSDISAARLHNRTLGRIDPLWRARELGDPCSRTSCIECSKRFMVTPTNEIKVRGESSWGINEG